MSNTTTNGMMYPTTKGMVGSNPADSARLSMVNKAQSQTTANKLMSGGKIKRKLVRYGGANDTSNSGIVVPQFQMPYEPQGGNGTNPNNQIQGNCQTSTQMAANSVYDSNASKMGGGSKCKRRKFCSTFSKSRKGGNPDWIWGCMSGGKKRSRKSRTTKRRNKHKKTRKNRKH
jgi:hypothetical protein